MRIRKGVMSEKGQALVLVLLSLAVVLTLVLFILSRSITDILVSSKGEEAARAFSAAEAGIERALVAGTGGTPISGQFSNAGYTYNSTPFAEGETSFSYPLELSSGDSMTTWFVSHDADGNPTCADGKCFTGSQLTVCWGRPGTLDSTATTPAIEVSLFYESSPGDPRTVKIGRGVYDPNPSRRLDNSFSAIDGACSGGVAGVSYAFQKTIDLTSLVLPGTPLGTENVLQFMRLRMFYNSDVTHLVGLSVPSGSFPSQGINVISTGTAGTSNRKVAVFQGWPEAPSVFDYTIYSAQGLTKP